MKVGSQMKMSKNLLLLVIFFISLISIVYGQQSRQNRYFVTVKNPAKYPSIHDSSSGFQRKYIETAIQILEVDPGTDIYAVKKVRALLCFEGIVRNSKKEGVFNVFLTDSLDKSKIYKIYTQTYVNDKLNGIWTTYSIEGNLVGTEMFKDDSLHGISKRYFSDGTTLINEVEYFNGSNKYIMRFFYPNGRVKAEISYLNDVVDGIGKQFYETGTIKVVSEFKKGVLHGHDKYFHPNGQLWIDILYKEGKRWDVIANYSASGVKRNAGTLLNGNGTVIYYNEDGSIREIATYAGGVEKQN